MLARGREWPSCSAFPTLPKPPGDRREERQVDLKAPWHYGRVEMMPPWCHYSPRLISAELACEQVLACGRINCMGEASDGLPTQAWKHLWTRTPPISRLCMCVGFRMRHGDSEKPVRVMSV